MYTIGTSHPIVKIEIVSSLINGYNLPGLESGGGKFEKNA